MPPTGSAPKPKAEEDVPCIIRVFSTILAPEVIGDRCVEAHLNILSSSKPKRAGKRRVADPTTSGDDETCEERCRSDCFGRQCLFTWKFFSPL
ncbi:hypothetical protein Taro_049652 [Colocasia esculenta]|uniref:Uncharacterized protein n=1 Tax=Colocasia esculenta TaxID=4460 RepID=A0A843XBB9_COLES|nr:hypothetical protein [Colocasia esculenta]